MDVTKQYCLLSITNNVCVIIKCFEATILCELGGGELSGNPQGFLSATLEDEAGGNVWAAVKVVFTAG